MVQNTLFFIIAITIFSHADGAEQQQRSITEQPKTFATLTKRDCIETCVCTGTIALCSIGYCTVAHPILIPSIETGAKACTSLWCIYNGCIAYYVYRTGRDLDKHTK